MYTCSSLLQIITLQVIFIFISIFMIECEERKTFLSNIDRSYCPFIETLSFGSDINIKCNNSYLIFDEINSDILNWKFANQTSICIQNGTQQASINQCGISRIDSDYLKVPLKSLELREKACIYCRVNYKPIAPLITVTQTDEGENILYNFNITAIGLAYNESLEILWAKRVHGEMRHSFNYWFLPKCIDFAVRIIEDTGHTIIFTVDDVAISRVEFIIRRCNGICRHYDKCSDDEFNKEIASNYLPSPDSIEKISCDYDCLNGIITTPMSTLTHVSPKVSPITTSTNATPFSIEQKMKLIILSSLIGLLLIISLLIFMIYKLCRTKRKKHNYAKANIANPDEHK